MHSSRKYLVKSAMALHFNTLRIVPLIISELLWSTFSPSEPSASWSLHSNEVLEYGYSRRIGCEMRTAAFPSPLTWSHMSLVRNVTGLGRSGYEVTPHRLNAWSRYCAIRWQINERANSSSPMSPIHPSIQALAVWVQDLFSRGIKLNVRFSNSDELNRTQSLD